MAKKLAIVVLAAALLLVAVAEAATHRTIITTTTVEEVDNPRGGGSRCREQMQVQQQKLSHCKMYLSESQWGMSLRMITPENPQKVQHLDQCCSAMEQIDEQCRCEVIKMMVQEQQQQGQMQQEEMRQMMTKAENLPRKCSLEPQQCQMRAIWF